MAEDKPKKPKSARKVIARKATASTRETAYKHSLTREVKSGKFTSVSFDRPIPPDKKK